MRPPALNILSAARWPDGFVCPGCGSGKAWRLETKAWTYECASGGRQTAVTAGTIMHHSKLPLTAWFWAAYLMATHSNGISALQLQRQLAFGSYKTAWLLRAKLRRSMLAPGRSPLAGLVEVDETEIACRSKNDPVTGGGGRSHKGKMLVVGAVEAEDGGLGPGRMRLSQVADYSATSHARERRRPHGRGDGRIGARDRRDHLRQPARGAARRLGPQYGRVPHRAGLLTSRIGEPKSGGGPQRLRTLDPRTLPGAVHCLPQIAAPLHAARVCTYTPLLGTGPSKLRSGSRPVWRSCDGRRRSRWAGSVRGDQ